MTPTTPPSPTVGDVITTVGELDALLSQAGQEAEPLVVREAFRVWILTEDEDGQWWAWSWREEGENGNPVHAEALSLPLTVLHTGVDAPPAAPTAGVDREALVNALRPVLCNASSYPREVQPRILGRDMGPLLAAAADAVLAFLADQPTPAPVGAAAVERPAHGPDWSDWDFDHPEEWPSCRCGFNGSPEECAAARAGEVQR